MILRIQPGSRVPPYEQIRSQVATMATTGVLSEGTRLPTIRQLSRDLGLAGGTVARAYRELEADGVIVTRGRHGSFLADSNGHGRHAASDDVLADVAQAFVVQARQLGADSERAVKLVQEAFESLGGRS